MPKLRFALLLALVGGLPACLPFGQKVRHQALCGKATLQLLHNLQKEYFRQHRRYAFYEELHTDPPEECRNDWFYSLEVAPDGQAYLLKTEQRSTGGLWTIDHIGFLRDADENAAKGKK